MQQVKDRLDHLRTHLRIAARLQHPADHASHVPRHTRRSLSRIQSVTVRGQSFDRQIPKESLQPAGDQPVVNTGRDKTSSHLSRRSRLHADSVSEDRRHRPAGRPAPLRTPPADTGRRRVPPGPKTLLRGCAALIGQLASDGATELTKLATARVLVSTAIS